jgi:t-SNARE complex subunit (syntaxin)
LSALTTETIGSLRADIRRVESTLGARLDLRVGATELLVRDVIQGEIRRLRQELAQFREETAQVLSQLRRDIRRQSSVDTPLAPDAVPAGAGPVAGLGTTGERL